jgi:hypothetical protein
MVGNYRRLSMKILIAGSRSIADYDLLVKVINKLNWKITEIVSGGAYGVDKLGIRYAKENNIKCTMFLPDWDTHGKKAGILRNKDMVEYADALIALWDGESKGTKFTIDYAKQKKLTVHVETLASSENDK